MPSRRKTRLFQRINEFNDPHVDDYLWGRRKAAKIRGYDYQWHRQKPHTNGRPDTTINGFMVLPYESDDQGRLHWTEDKLEFASRQLAEAFAAELKLPLLDE